MSLSFVIRLDYFRIVITFVIILFLSFLHHESHFREKTAKTSSGIHRLPFKTTETEILQHTDTPRGHELDPWLTRGGASQASHEIHDPRKIHVVEIHRHPMCYDHNNTILTHSSHS